MAKVKNTSTANQLVDLGAAEPGGKATVLSIAPGATVEVPDSLVVPLGRTPYNTLIEMFTCGAVVPVADLEKLAPSPAPIADDQPAPAELPVAPEPAKRGKRI